MASEKQIQNRLVTKKKYLKNIIQYMSTAEKNNKKVLLRKLSQEKGDLRRSITKLERQLIMKMKASKEKKTLNLYPDNV